VVLHEHIPVREDALPTDRPTSKDKPVAIQTFVSENVRDNFNKLAILTGLSTFQLLAELAEHTVLQNFVPPVTGPSQDNEFAMQALVERSTRKKFGELARQHRLSTAELLRRLIEHAVSQEFVRDMTEALDKTRQEARARLLKTLAPSTKVRPS
jgi:hypothetical protein